jgi:hypothetical protein
VAYWRLVAARLGLLAMLVAFGGADAAAETVCRPDSLGAERCTGPVVRPLPRPPRLRSRVQALDRVIERDDAGQSNTEFVPSSRRNRLGTTIIDEAPGSDLCRPDALGNLRCR